MHGLGKSCQLAERSFSYCTCLLSAGTVQRQVSLLAGARLGDTQLTLTKQYPLNGGNKIAMRLDADSGAGGIINTGFWGISVDGWEAL